MVVLYEVQTKAKLAALPNLNCLSTTLQAFFGGKLKLSLKENPILLYFYFTRGHFLVKFTSVQEKLVLHSSVPQYVC